MIRIVIAATMAACTIATALPAYSADIPMRPYYQSQMPSTFYNWTGLYLGGHGGYSWGKEREQYSDQFTQGYDRSIDMNGAIFGGHIGAQKQFGRFVFGVEADWTKTLQKGSSTEISTNTTIDDPKLNWVGTARIRAGFLPFERLHVYATGGGAYGMLRNTHNEWSNSGTHLLTIDTKQALAGYALGAGVEYALGNSWVVGAEWLHLNLNAIDTTISGMSNSHYRETLTDNIFRGRISFRF